ncbi:TRAP transporter permease, partial [Sulfitobacter sp.]|uniref:TRAP transporter permease n=1 Tax=Sulfitobacter sp. TaxID=1903071 RepID=UPI003002374B
MSDTQTQTTSDADAEHSSETTRLGALFSWTSIAFVVLCICGLGLDMGMGMGLAYAFGVPFGGKRLIEGQYYWFFIGIFLAAAFIALPATKSQRTVPIYDIIATVLALGTSMWFSTYAWDIVQAGWTSFPAGVVLWVLMLEVARRSGGVPFLLVVFLLGLYPLVADFFPGLLMGIPYTFERMIEAHVFRTEGLMGITTKIVAEIVLGFFVFAGVLIATGAGQFFIDLANAGFGKYRGGAAKVSIVASAFFGSLSGSIFSNIAGTGSITIPIMKKVGYPPHYAAAIEACASTGGVVMPPVMGAIAFVMAITIGVDYATIMVAAILPSFLFYFGLILQVDAYAARKGLVGMAPDKLPSAREVLKRGWPFLLVMVFLVWGLLYMRWEYYAPWYASALMIALSFLQRDTMMTPTRLFATLRQVGVLVVKWSGKIGQRAKMYPTRT